MSITIEIKSRKMSISEMNFSLLFILSRIAPNELFHSLFSILSFDENEIITVVIMCSKEDQIKCIFLLPFALSGLFLVKKKVIHRKYVSFFLFFDELLIFFSNKLLCNSKLDIVLIIYGIFPILLSHTLYCIHFQ
jgi:hypothetical protein